MQHDNDPKHRARIVTNWLNQKGVEWFKWPSFSSDLNPIEHIWDKVERRMKKEKPNNETELKQGLLRIWHGG
jgi:transposase